MKTNVRNYTSTELLNKVKSLNSFKAIPDGYWILGARSNEDAPNVFDDKGYLFRGEQFIKVFPMTTNAGVPYLQGGFLKYNKVGVAHVKANEWYHDLWAYGLHHGKMPALVQVGNILIFRDGDMDVHAEEIGKVIKGLFGINFHSTKYDFTYHVVTPRVGEWSAGCQVVNDTETYLMIINMIKNQHRITYCLIDEF